MSSNEGRVRQGRATASDVARLAGVSPATVSYVLNEAPGQSISPATRERVRAAAAKLAYVPSAAAASLRRGHSRIVVILTEPALLGFAAETFLRSACERLAEEGLMPLTHPFASEDSALALCDSVRPYGVIALTSHRGELVEELRAAGIPLVYSSTDGDPGYPRPWEEEIGETQAEHMVGRGLRRLLYVRPYADHPRTVMARSREMGAARVGTQAGLPALRLLEASGDVDVTAHRLASVLVSDEPTGICAFDDEVAAEVLAALSLLDAKIPGDAAVIGVDDAPFASFLSPALTTVALDMRRTGRSLAERFLGLASAEDNAHPPRAHARVVVRASA